MSLQNITAATIMNASAALLNDPAKTSYTFVKQIPYLNIALQELQEFFELNEIPVVDTVPAVIEVPAGTEVIKFTSADPKLPDDLVEPLILWERASGTDPYVPMTRKDFLPHNMEGTQITQFNYYTWQSQEIRFFPSVQANDIKIDYIRSLFFPIVETDTPVKVINSASFLEFRTAALCAEFLGENKTRADDLNGFAGLAVDRVIGIGAKSKQNIMTRRKPFRSAYKRHSFM